MAKQPLQPATPALAKGRLLVLLGFLLLMYVVVPRIGSFSQSFDALSKAHAGYIGLAVSFMIFTYILAAGMYYLLALSPLLYGRTFLVQCASAFTNRLLPAGLGAVGLYVQYLRKHGHTTTQAIAVAGTSSVLGGVGHALLAAAALAIGGGTLFNRFHMPHPSYLWLIAAGIVAALALLFVISKRLRHYVRRQIRQLVEQIARYRARPLRLFAALLCSCLLTSSFVLLFYMCALALDVQVSLLQAFVVFTLGVAAGTATPTPGGLVGAEAGLTAGLVAYGAPASAALATALLYRLITYWAPLLPGFVVFILNRRLYM